MSNLRPKIYFTADWHIGHANVLEMDSRPWSTTEEMHEGLIKNFNYLVPEHGITYFLGDMGLCSGNLLRSVITRLNGTKILIRGNHDGNIFSMYHAGFDVVIDKAQITIGKNIVTMTHCPLKGVFREDVTGMRGVPDDHTDNWHGESKNKDRFSIEDFGQFHLHGHIHSPNSGKSVKILGRQMDVGVPAWKYKPVSLSEIESWIAKYNNIHGAKKWN